MKRHLLKLTLFPPVPSYTKVCPCLILPRWHCLLAVKPREARKETHSRECSTPGRARGGAECRDRPISRRSQRADPEGGPARAERRGLSQAPDARCRWQLGGAAATAAGGARIWRPLLAFGSPFPPPRPRLDPGESEGKSRCSGTCKQRYLSLPVRYFFFPLQGRLCLGAGNRLREERERKASETQLTAALDRTD
ncbi:hypothetical protein H1C71_036780 [Ictidomys tridecemlineatus]|nr:hypothetical protein H1C71_036780 [Ictidomys tridecemlineatus]